MIVYEGATYASTEHAFQVAKTLNQDQRVTIRRAASPGKAKALGRKVTLREDWESVKVSVMKELLDQKFALGRDEARMLLETGDALLIEGNTWGDRFWGVSGGVGQNHLGQLLMRRREALASEGRR